MFEVPTTRCVTEHAYISVAVGLEGSRQEATPLPSTTFDIFSRCVLLGTLHPHLALSDAAVFSLSWRRLLCAAPVTHQDQGLLMSRGCARHLPLASSCPRKPSVPYRVQFCTAYRSHGSLTGPTLTGLTAEASGFDHGIGHFMLFEVGSAAWAPVPLSPVSRQTSIAASDRKSAPLPSCRQAEEEKSCEWR